MDDLNQSEFLTQQLEPSTAKTEALPRPPPAAHKDEENFRVGQSRILEMIAANAPLSEILKSLVLLIEAQSPEMLCSVLLLSDDGNQIRHGAAPSLPGEYVNAIDGAPIGPKNGSCGTAMYRGKSVIVSDVLEDPLWEDYRDLASASGLRACWSTPIMSGRGKVLGSFAMYYRQPQTPTGAETRLTDVATHIAGLAIEHQSAREALVRAQAELARASQAVTMGEVAASIAHEINQPLGAIVSNADRCLQLLDESRPDVARLREALTNIAGDGRQAVEVIARIRTLAKHSAPQKVPLNLNELAREVLDLIDREAQRKRVTLQAELADGLPSVPGDRVQLQQALLNLVMNGLEAMNGISDRTLELTVKTVRAENGEVVVAITDRGTGIKPRSNLQSFPYDQECGPGNGAGYQPLDHRSTRRASLGRVEYRTRYYLQIQSSGRRTWRVAILHAEGVKCNSQRQAQRRPWIDPHNILALKGRNRFKRKFTSSATYSYP